MRDLPQVIPAVCAWRPWGVTLVMHNGGCHGKSWLRRASPNGQGRALEITGGEMKKILVLLFAAVLAAAPAFASHHRRHRRYHEGRPGPVIVIRP